MVSPWARTVIADRADGRMRGVSLICMAGHEPVVCLTCSLFQIPEQESAPALASDSTMTGTAADTTVAAAADPDAVSPATPAPEPQNKPLKGLLKSSPSSGDKSKKRVQFSETLLVFCDDWPEELMPQIIALKSPSDFSLVEVAAQGYMFEPPVEYQDCLSFDPPPDYRDMSRGDAASGGSDSGSDQSQESFAFIDSPAGKSIVVLAHHSHLLSQTPASTGSQSFSTKRRIWKKRR